MIWFNMNYIEWGYASGTAYNSLLLTSKKIKMKIIDINILSWHQKGQNENNYIHSLENRKGTNEI